MMTRALEITLKSSFTSFCKGFIGGFADSYFIYGGMPAEDFSENLELYKSIIEDNCEAIYRIAAREINKYLLTYDVRANKSADEFKIVYFLGKAIEKYLISEGYVELSLVHMFTIIALLDFRLRFVGIEKPVLARAMIKLVRLNIINDEMGSKGLYLTYKCVSSTPK